MCYVLHTCRPACPSALFHTWETLLQEVEIDSQAHSDIASILGRQVSRPLLERSFHRKIQSRKVFTHRESYETILTKTEDKMAKVQWVKHTTPDVQKARDSHISVLTCRNALVTSSHKHWFLRPNQSLPLATVSPLVGGLSSLRVVFGGTLLPPAFPYLDRCEMSTPFLRVMLFRRLFSVAERKSK